MKGAQEMIKTLEINQFEGLEERSSVQLRARILQIEERRARRRDDLEEKKALSRIAREDLADADDRRVRGGVDTIKETTALKRRIEVLEDDVRALSTALDREISESDPEIAALRSALLVAEQRERDEELSAQRRAREERITLLLRRQAKALAEVTEAEQGLEAEQAVLVRFGADLSVSIALFADAVLGRGIRMSRKDGARPYVWDVEDDTQPATTGAGARPDRKR